MIHVDNIEHGYLICRELDFGVDEFVTWVWFLSKINVIFRKDNEKNENHTLNHDRWLCQEFPCRDNSFCPTQEICLGYKL